MASPDTSYYPNMDESTSDEGNSSNDSETEDVGETALLPKSFFQGKDLKPGGRCEVEIVHLYDDEVEVRYAKTEERKSEPKMMMSANEEIDQMGGMMKG